MKSVTRIFIDRGVDGKVLFQPTPRKDSKKVLRCKSSRSNVSSAINVLKHHEVMMALQKLAHSCWRQEARAGNPRKLRRGDTAGTSPWK